MLGGFNSVKRENHHYKYAFCTNNDDIKRIYSDYKKDLTADNAWTYSLTSLVTGKDAFKDATISRFEGDLSNLKTVDRMFNGCKSLKTWNVELPNLTNGYGMFDTCSISKWDIELPNLTTGNYMFYNCPLSKWNIELSKLVNADRMFLNGKLTEWNIDLPNLSYAPGMFYNNLFTTFNGILPKLKNCESMFTNCKLLKTWDIELPTLQTAYCMYKGCSSLSEFNVNLPNLTDGRYMFQWCSLIHFNSELPLLSNAQGMFEDCILNKQSVSNIINSIPTYTSGSHPITIGIHVDNRCDEEISSIIAEGTSKGWTVTTQWNGNPTKDEVINSEKIAKLELNSITLPEGYKRCEYLESDTNNQYIDTEIIPTNTTGTWIIAKRITDTVDGFHLAVRTDSNNYYPPMLRSNGNYHGWGAVTEWTNFTKQNTAFESYINYPINGTIVKEAIVINNVGTTVTKELTTDLPTISQSLYMFGRNYNGTLDRTWNGRIYRAKISEGDQIIRDFIPALDPDGKPCMRDIINGVDYYNQGTEADFNYKIAQIAENESPEEDNILDSLELIDTLTITHPNIQGMLPTSGGAYIDSEIEIENGDTLEYYIESGNHTLLSEKNNLACGPALISSPILAVAPIGHSALSITTDSVDEGEAWRVTFTEDEFDVNGTTPSTNTRAATDLPINTIQLPDLKGIIMTPSASPSAEGVSLDLKYWKISGKADMVPARHNDGRTGLYCKIRNTFLPIQYLP